MSLPMNASPPERLLPKSMVSAMALSIAYMGFMLFVYLFPPPGVFEPPLLLPVLNTIFTGAIPLAVAFISFRTYLAGGQRNLMFMGCGFLSFGLAAILAGWLIGGTQGINVNVTIYNLGALLGAIFHSLTIYQDVRSLGPDEKLKHRRLKVIGMILAIAVFQLCLTLAVLNGVLPLFFVQEVGPTPLRQGVLGVATVLLAFSAMRIFKRYQNDSQPYYVWYGLSLLMIALGLVAAFVQPSVGSPMGWLGRGGHYVAGLYALIAVMATSGLAHQKGESFSNQMKALFRQAQMSYEVLLEAVTEPIVTTDQDFRIIQWNSAAERKFGYSPMEAMGRSLFDLVLTADSSAVLQSHANEIATSAMGQPAVGHLIDLTGKTKTSVNLALELSLSAAKLRGRLLFVCIFRDNTKREAAQRQHLDEILTATHRHHQDVVSALSEAVFTIVSDGSIRSMNPAIERLFGLSAEQLKGRNALDNQWHQIQEDGSPFPNEKRPGPAVFRTGVPQLNVVIGIYRPDGTLTWCITNAVPIFTSGSLTPEIVVVTFVDITQRKKLEKEHQLLLNRLRATLDAIPDLMLEMSLEGKFCEIRNHRTDLFRTPPNHLVGKFVRDVMSAHAGSTVMAALQEAHLNGYSSGKMISISLPQGETWFELSVSRRATVPDEETRLIVLARDVTMLVRHQSELETLVSERTQEIAVLNKNLRQEKQQATNASLAKSDFLSNMSHELRTPLNALIGLSSLLVQSPLNPRQLDYAEKIQLSAKTLATLVDDILDLSKIEANELHAENAPFSLHHLLNNTAWILGVSVLNKPIEVILDLLVNVPDRLIGDPLRLQQILLNLISNAVKFTEAGEIVLSVRYVAGHHALDRSQDTLEFGVRDTGIGMTAETQKLIFNSFIQANASTSRLYGGSGLGLAISARLTTLIGGKLEVQSELGQGTDFRLTLPVVLDHDSVAPPITGIVVPTLADLNILIVDNHPLAQDILARTCRDLGWRAHAVDSAAAALQALMSRSNDDTYYDLVLLDWHMPEMDGLALLGQILKDPRHELPPVLLMVAAAEVEQAVTASAEFNIDGIIAKPLTPSSLLKGIASAFEPAAEVVVQKSPSSHKPLAGLRLLVADDNALNQEVIEQILLNAGAQVALVANGQLAVDALRAPGAHFDAVLMDIQMPVMDGYTATRLIRNTLGMTDLPILALTAHVRPEDRKASRLAGMTGHLAKPLDVQVLLDLVVNLVRLRTHADAPQIGMTPTPQTGLRLPGLNLAQAAKAFGDNQEGYGRLLSKFMAQQGNDIAEARKHFTTGNYARAIRLMHDLTGVAGLLQAPELSRLAALAEKALLNEKSDELLLLFDQLQAAMDTVIASILDFEATTA